jgi:L-ribulokinase
MYTLGIDYGTNSVRALLVRCSDGAEVGSCVVNYPSGQQGILLDSKDHHLARQHPGDYLFGLEKSVKGALAQAKKVKGFSASAVVGIGVDTTGSSPIPVDKHNVPLALTKKWAKNLAAQCWLWKDHTSWREAAKITELAAAHRPQFIASAATPTHPSGGGRSSGTAATSPRRSSKPPIPGSSSATGSRPCSPA